jgi:hypothetical protein
MKFLLLSIFVLSFAATPTACFAGEVEKQFVYAGQTGSLPTLDNTNEQLQYMVTLQVQKNRPALALSKQDQHRCWAKEDDLDRYIGEECADFCELRGRAVIGTAEIEAKSLASGQLASFPKRDFYAAVEQTVEAKCSEAVFAAPTAYMLGQFEEAALVGSTKAAQAGFQGWNFANLIQLKPTSQSDVYSIEIGEAPASVTAFFAYSEEATTLAIPSSTLEMALTTN